MDYKKEIERYIDGFKKNEKNPLQYLNKELKGKKICVFGAGFIGMCAARILSKANIKVDFFCDNNPKKWGIVLSNGVRCISPKELIAYKEDVNIVIATNQYKVIMQQLENYPQKYALVDLNLNKYENNIFYNASTEQLDEYKVKLNQTLNILEDDRSKEILVTMIKRYYEESPFHCYYENIYYGDEQYYPMNIINLNEVESFVDCGAYIGDSMETFFHKVNYKFENFYGFELGRTNFEKLSKKVEKIIPAQKNKVFLYNQGVWDKKQKINFLENVEGTSSLSNQIVDGIDKSQLVDSIDNVLGDNKATFIKMDIEGAELKALYGAEQIIRLQKPKLAISIYHKIEDLWEIPLYIKTCMPYYKIYFRHHTLLDQDTVCYAVFN